MQAQPWQGEEQQVQRRAAAVQRARALQRPPWSLRCWACSTTSPLWLSPLLLVGVHSGFSPVRQPSRCLPRHVRACLHAALNDAASYALIAWQSSLYERSLGLRIEDYAPVLGTLLPVAGILGGGCAWRCPCSNLGPRATAVV